MLLMANGQVVKLNPCEHCTGWPLIQCCQGPNKTSSLPACLMCT